MAIPHSLQCQQGLVWRTVNTEHERGRADAHLILQLETEAQAEVRQRGRADDAYLILQLETEAQAEVRQRGRADAYLILQLETEAQRGQAATMLESNWWPHD